MTRLLIFKGHVITRIWLFEMFRVSCLLLFFAFSLLMIVFLGRQLGYRCGYLMAHLYPTPSPHPTLSSAFIPLSHRYVRLSFCPLIEQGLSCLSQHRCWHIFFSTTDSHDITENQTAYIQYICIMLLIKDLYH